MAQIKQPGDSGKPRRIAGRAELARYTLTRALITGGGALLHPRLYSSRPYFLRSSSEGAFAGLTLFERGISVWPRVAPTTRLGAVARGVLLSVVLLPLAVLCSLVEYRDKGTEGTKGRAGCLHGRVC